MCTLIRFVSLFSLLLSIMLAGCSEKEFDPNDPQKSFGIAKEPYDEENYEIAVQRLGEFKARFPYSKYSTEAELLSANAQFELGRYTEAALAYEQFVKLHPKHPKADYASFRVGESYWEDAPQDIDREQDYTLKAIKEWQKLVERFPESSYTPKAKELIQKGKRRVAESILFVVKFYCKQGIYHACAYRAIELADEYGEFKDLRFQGLRFAIKALEQVAKAKEKNPSDDSNLYFQSMTAQDIKKRADQFKSLLNQAEQA